MHGKKEGKRDREEGDLVASLESLDITEPEINSTLRLLNY